MEGSSSVTAGNSPAGSSANNTQHTHNNNNSPGGTCSASSPRGSQGPQSQSQQHGSSKAPRSAYLRPRILERFVYDVWEQVKMDRQEKSIYQVRGALRIHRDGVLARAAAATASTNSSSSSSTMDLPLPRAGAAAAGGSKTTMTTQQQQQRSTTPRVYPPLKRTVPYPGEEDEYEDSSAAAAAAAAGGSKHPNNHHNNNNNNKSNKEENSNNRLKIRITSLYRRGHEPPLSSSANSSNKDNAARHQYAVSRSSALKNNNRITDTVQLTTQPVQLPFQPSTLLPRHTCRVRLKQNYFVADTKTLQYVPSTLGEDNENNNANNNNNNNQKRSSSSSANNSVTNEEDANNNQNRKNKRLNGTGGRSKKGGVAAAGANAASANNYNQNSNPTTTDDAAAATATSTRKTRSSQPASMSEGDGGTDPAALKTGPLSGGGDNNNKGANNGGSTPPPPAQDEEPMDDDGSQMQEPGYLWELYDIKHRERLIKYGSLCEEQESNEEIEETIITCFLTILDKDDDDDILDDANISIHDNDDHHLADREFDDELEEEIKFYRLRKLLLQSATLSKFIQTHKLGDHRPPMVSSSTSNNNGNRRTTTTTDPPALPVVVRSASSSSPDIQKMANDEIRAMLYAIAKVMDHESERIRERFVAVLEKKKKVKPPTKSGLAEQDDADGETDFVPISPLSGGAKSKTKRTALATSKGIDGSSAAASAAGSANAAAGSGDGARSSTGTNKISTVIQEEEERYLKIMDSYRNLYCRRCFVFDCNTHGLSEKPRLQFQFELGLEREHEGHWKSEPHYIKKDDSASNAVATTTTATTSTATTTTNVAAKEKEDATPSANANDDTVNKESETTNNETSASLRTATDSSMETTPTETALTVVPAGVSEGPDPFDSDTVTELTNFQKDICYRLFLIYEGQISQMALVMRAPRKLVEEYCKAKNFVVPKLELGLALPDSQKKNKKSYFSVKNYRADWYNGMKSTKTRPYFVPCHHEDPCRQGTCVCIDNNFFCTQACALAERSPNYFRGCNCSGRCNTVQCACFAAKRECNPDICLCGNPCTDPPNRPATTQHCLNDNITMRRHVHLVVAPSQLPDAGWGCYTKYPLKKGDFIGEYVGEMISQEEAERRGQFYDIQNQSSLFCLTSDYCLDADRKANKTRYINHSDEPNCRVQQLSVNGDFRIAFFAIRDIPAQDELFFDYRYKDTMDNKLLAKNMPWTQTKTAPAPPAASTTTGTKKASSKKKRASDAPSNKTASKKAKR